MGRKFVSNKTKFDHLTLIWLDANITENDENSYSMSQLSYLFNKILTFNRLDDFINYLITQINEQIILILSGSYGKQILNQIHSFSLIHSIYIFCQNTIYHRTWTKSFPKIQGVFNQIDLLCFYLQLNQKKKNQKKSSSMNNCLTFIENLIPSETNEQMKEEFLSFDNDQQSTIDSILICSSSNDHFSDENHFDYQHSQTVIPFLEPNHQQLMDNGIWPNLCWIIENEKNFFKMDTFDQIRHLIFNIDLITNIHKYLQLLDQQTNQEYFLVLCDSDYLHEYLPLICRHEQVRRVYIYSSLDNIEQYQYIIKRFSTIISVLSHADTLIHMILHDMIHYLVKLGEYYQKEKKNTLAKIRYEYALQLQSSIPNFSQRSIQ